MKFNYRLERIPKYPLFFCRVLILFQRPLLMRISFGKSKKTFSVSLRIILPQSLVKMFMRRQATYKHFSEPGAKILSQIVPIAKRDSHL
ncbi:MAG: hypothetical protein A2908_02600 [Candidatus Staskawiczbacteria bacterium RIFCSPLOWO2_01_FULL_38_12b]|uniref:Uncharacterized protein n=1 Tax=Candidatus Staskawiczbacteria bacterium RIFCSPLOWO2_01_FULL_38_12b TaxID=1802214 RepID=A0A1G2IAY4_9BACT|nr:MAG: hypothetical protein A2908_02600 [Candidatus Staskawiczbacteria bacterium RIFCSPLOWO2_01_FULL_38_12b]